jgi:hypothetical protein
MGNPHNPFAEDLMRCSISLSKPPALLALLLSFILAAGCAEMGENPGDSIRVETQDVGEAGGTGAQAALDGSVLMSQAPAVLTEATGGHPSLGAYGGGDLPPCPDGQCSDLRAYETDATEGSVLILHESAIRALPVDACLEVTVPVRNRTGAVLGAHVAVNLVDLLSGDVKAHACSGTALKSGLNTPTFVLEGIPDAVREGRFAEYVLIVRVSGAGETLVCRRSLYCAADNMWIRVFGQDTFFQGEEGALRVLVLGPDGRPCSGAEVTVDLSQDLKSQRLFSGLSDAAGSVQTSLAIPAGWTGKAQLSLTADCRYGVRRFESTVDLLSVCHTLITTDKPLYRPGQKMYVRTLTLSLPGFQPMAHAPLALEILDAKENKVLRTETDTDAFGVASATLELASEVNLGDYTIRAIQGESISEKKVEVREYVAPKFEVLLRSDAESLRPGGTLEGTLEVRYFFGKPLSGANLSLKAYRVDTAETLIAQISGKTNESGLYRFSVDVPESFDVAALEKGRASVRLAATVYDVVAHPETGGLSVPVTDGSLCIHLVALSDPILPGVANPFCAIVTLPNGQPVQALCTVKPGSGLPEVLTADEKGMCLFDVKPEAGTLKIGVCAIYGGTAVDRSFSFAAAQGAALRVGTDRVLYRVGEKVTVDVRSTVDLGAVFVDVLKEGRPLAGITVPMAARSGTGELTLGSSAVGMIRIGAMAETGAGLVQASRLIFVRKETDLRVSMQPDKEVYKPGEEAMLRFRVTDEEGNPRVSSLGFSIVDESILSLKDFEEGVELSIFSQSSETPGEELPGFGLGDALQAEEDKVRQQLAAVALSGFSADLEYAIQYDSRSRDKARARSTQADIFNQESWKIVSFIQGRCIRSVEQYHTAVAGCSPGTTPPAADPWGTPWRLDIRWYSYSYYDYYCGNVRSLGLDETAGTVWDLRRFYSFIVWTGGGHPAPMPPPPAPTPAPAPVPSPTPAPSPGGGEGVYVRDYFPETLYFNPSLITDPDGTASVTLRMADAITTWRVQGLASSRTGCLGTLREQVRVFQPFFIRVDLPPILTQGDVLVVPVAVFNYLTSSQTVRLRITPAPWFELLDAAEKNVEVGARATAGSGFHIRVLTPGGQALRVDAEGQDCVDAVSMGTDVRADGREITFTKSGVIAASGTAILDIDPAAIEGGSRGRLKIYAQPVAQVIEGLDSLIRVPYG